MRRAISKTRSFDMQISTFFIIALSAIFYSTGLAQEVTALYTEEEIVIDGRLLENPWINATGVTDFVQFVPNNGQRSKYETMVKVLYSNTTMYFSFSCKDPDMNNISAQITDRDGNVDDDDAVVIMLDTFADGNNAYFFMVNPLGTQLDGRFADNGRTEDNNWDGEWYSAVTRASDGWYAELAIPLKTIRFAKRSTAWGFNAGRFVPRDLEESFWAKDQTTPERVSQFGRIVGLDLSQVVTKPYTLIPYFQSQLEEKVSSREELGGDFRYNLSSNIGVDVTINPDFATIEADVEEVNLTRFELEYPEKRPFFQEGNENYSTRIQQFYSRRVGEIPWGAKVNAKIEDWKFNVLTTQSDPSTAGLETNIKEDATYTAFRLNREIFEGSAIGLIGANRYYEKDNTGSVGLASTLFFTDDLGMTSQFIKSYGSADKGTWTFFVRPSYDSEFSHFHVRYTHIGEGVRENINPVGFIRDDDRREVDSNLRREVWINKYGLEVFEASTNYNRYWSQTGTLRSWNSRNSLELTFLKKWEYELGYIEDFKKFEKDFRNTSVENVIRYDTKTGKAYSLEYEFGKNFDSDFEELVGGLEYTLTEGWNLNYELTKLWFNPDPENETSWQHLIKSTYHINPNLFFRLLYQSRYDLRRTAFDKEYDLGRETTQLVFVWRFLPPFGSLQIAYQQGSSRIEDEEGIGKTLFSKLTWVF